MKDKKIFVYCEYCNKAYEDISPPSKEQYKQGVIQLGEFSSVLLNVKRNASSSHSKNLEGIYCDIDCLTKHIEKARGDKL